MPRTRGTVIYSPAQTLEAGEYSVACTVELDQKYKVEKTWSFKVSDKALDQLPSPSDQQLSAVQAVNDFRASLGLKPFSVSPSLCESSRSHAAFMKTNRVFGHAQEEGLAGFTGIKPLDRAQAFGHEGGLWEDVAMAFESPKGFVEQLFHAPYHRIPFMQPGTTSVGAGFDANFACIDFGSSAEEGTVVSPSQGQTSVPLSWDGIESPSPLRIHSTKAPVGYVIILSHFTQANEKLICDSSSLKSGSTEIPYLLNTPDKRRPLDQLDTAPSDRSAQGEHHLHGVDHGSHGFRRQDRTDMVVYHRSEVTDLNQGSDTIPKLRAQIPRNCL